MIVNHLLFSMLINLLYLYIILICRKGLYIYMLNGTEYMLKPNNSTKFNDLSDKDIQTKLFVYSICKDMDTSVELQDGPVVIRDRIINLGEECCNINMLHPQDELFQDDAFII